MGKNCVIINHGVHILIEDKVMTTNEALGILGLQATYTEDDIKSVYKKLALLHHPDRHSRAEVSVKKNHDELFKKVGEAYECLTKASNDNPLDDILNAWFSDSLKKSFSVLFQFTTRTERMESLPDIFQKRKLDLNNLSAFNAMTDEEVAMVFHNIGGLLWHHCLNQESFDLACGHLSWPNKKKDDINNPYVSKFIFQSLVAQENLNIPPESHLSHYEKLVEAFNILSGCDDESDDDESDDDESDFGRRPSYPSLVTQERLNHLIKHSSVATDFATTIAHLYKANLLTLEKEAFTLDYLSKMGDSMFSTLANRLSSKNEAETIEILEEAGRKLDWVSTREQCIENIKEINLKKIADTKQDFWDKCAHRKYQTIDLGGLKEKSEGWPAYDKERLFQTAEDYAKAGYLSAEQLNSSHYLMLSFITHNTSENLTRALTEGLVTIDALNNLCLWSVAKGINNGRYLQYFLSDSCIELNQKGLFSIDDVYFFESPVELEEYIEELTKNLTVNVGIQNTPSSSTEREVEQEELRPSAIKIQSLFRSYLARKNIKIEEQAKKSASDNLAPVIVSPDDSEPRSLTRDFPLPDGHGSVLPGKIIKATQDKSTRVICTKEFALILETYKSQSFLGFLSSFWIFSWIPSTRSQTMRELKALLLSTHDNNSVSVSQDQIEAAINKGDNKTHRLELFKEEVKRIKTTGTDEVIVQLKDALNKTP